MLNIRTVGAAAVGAGCLTLGLSSLAADPASALSFTYTGSLQSFTVPTTGAYNITAFGAQGGSGVSASSGGLGGETGANFNLTAGQILTILVGGQGTSSGLFGAGGGGSFVALGNTPIAVAGGGGGGALGSAGGGGIGGSIGSFIPGAGIGGTGGTNTTGGNNGNGGGGGFSTNGGNGAGNASGNGGSSFLNGGAGGTGFNGVTNLVGGFGGGGGGNGGGGGGFNGGAGGNFEVGGSGGIGFVNTAFLATPANAVFMTGVQSGNGLVQINSVPVPTPVLLPDLLGIGVAALRKKRKSEQSQAEAIEA